MRKLPQRAQTRDSMMTEYQERFRPPCYHMAVVTTSIQKNPYHPLKGTNTAVTGLRSYYVKKMWVKNPPQPPQPPASPKSHRRCKSAPHNPVSFVAKVDDYKSVYQNDFPAWNVNKRQPYKMHDSLKPNQGLIVPDSDSKKGHFNGSANSTVVPQVKEPEPIESITSYRSAYVSHPVQPRFHREKPNKGLTIEPAVSMRPKGTLDVNKQMYGTSEEFFEQFKTMSLENTFYTAHECPRTKPVLPSMQRSEKSKKPFQATTTTKEDYKAWYKFPCSPSVHEEELDWHKKTLSVYTPNLGKSSRSSQKTVSLPSTPTPVCNSSENPQCPAENRVFYGYECISNGAEESRRWTTSVDRGGPWADGVICDEPSQNHKLHGF
ncbi:stabilizer of axonemal microtubules 1-like isoform X1 [Acanthopagrus latus]|uniref:stabilizer of axonemal microtubules 1-like isoform X1 n=2 Tax=Acanthopagrus latus TaxID=8177 RepID=UPI00187BCD1A|nr:stabilizer of axonemal microtubules 1-like isoform X1 [Acanthopagrus latus]